MDGRRPTSDGGQPTNVHPSTFNFGNPWLQIALIVAVAAFFRLWQIGSIPPGLFGDEATDGLDALDVLAGRGAIFFPANFGREGLHMWLVAGMFRLMGVTPLALRLPSALAGIATALATYWLGRELVAAYRAPDEGRRTKDETSVVLGLWSFVPLVAALYIATSYWHVHFSRFGIRGVFTPLLGALAFAAFWRAVNLASRQISKSAERRAQIAATNPQYAIRNTQYVWFAFSGLFLGLATHFYTASRFYPFFLGGFLILQAVIAYATGRREQVILRRNYWGIVVLFAVAALIFAPLGLYFVQHPGSFTQRAAEVAATKAANPWLRMGQAAAANVMQFFVPGQGDPEQFYNLPRRAVFDPLTAFLALIGIGVLLWRWRQPAALFLLAWVPALLLPSFLATDRWPTLPRVLGVIPAVYFYPAVGLLFVAGMLGKILNGRTGEWENGRKGEREISHSPTPPLAHSVTRPRAPAPLVLCVLALLISASSTYRDYFRNWGHSQATFDAFEGDMAAAATWLRNNAPAGHVYLSSDIYRHPTFMLLGEQATVQTYFQHRDPYLSWFDAGSALPLPPPGQPATYLIGSGAPLSGQATAILAADARTRDRVLAPDGSPALTVIDLPGGAQAARPGIAISQAVSFTDQLALTGAELVRGQDDALRLNLTWRTTGPDPGGWPGYRLEVAGLRPNGDSWQDDVPFDAFRPPEWVPGGSVVTWHKLDVPGGELLHDLRLRLLRAGDRQPVTRTDAPDGWRDIVVR
jgi:4-amino-4-deoxy-L-arabinose transferase-like glycosyltransferase